MRGLGLTETYVDAQRIVTALDRARSDATYYDTALAILAQYVGDERILVANKAIALGADQAVVNNMLATLGTGDEVIEIVGTAPVIKIGNKRVSWWAVFAGVVGIVGGAWTHAKYGKALTKLL